MLYNFSMAPEQLSFDDNKEKAPKAENVVSLNEFREKTKANFEVEYFKTVYEKTKHLFGDSEERLQK